MRGAEERERWIRMERSKVKSKRALESISFGCPSFSFCRGTTRSSDRTDGRTDGRSEGGRPNGGPCSRACALFPPPVCRPSASASSVRSFLVGVPFVVVVDPLRERASVRQFQSCFLPFHSPLSEERKKETEGKERQGTFEEPAAPSEHSGFPPSPPPLFLLI